MNLHSRLTRLLQRQEWVPLYLKMLAVALAVGFGLRVVLACMPATSLADAGFAAVAAAFVLGAVNDAMVATIAFIPLWLFCLSCCRRKFRRPEGWLWLGALALLEAALLFCARPLEEFNAPLHRILCWTVVVWAATFALRMLVPSVRDAWVRVWLAVIIGVYLALTVFNAIGEWLFWDEFGVRYNFIAVDYLVYTSEVVGNIVESYPVGWITAAIVAVAAALEWLLFRHDIRRAPQMHQQRPSLAALAAYAALVAVSFLGLGPMSRIVLTDNMYCRQLQASGLYSFVQAFSSNTIEYEPFYLTNPPETIEADMRRVLYADSIPGDSAELRPNIILVTMESMSADYMERYGGEKHLTPALDSLCTRSLVFDNMLAAGNRTVRGLEALTLSRPPSPGESIIKREEREGYPSIADALRQRGYSLTFVYGGDSYFDNMGAFFSELGYDIADSDCFSPQENTCSTVWGICDGDVYSKLLKLADERQASGWPFFMHMLTTSNHRPYIYPEGKISIPPSEKRRDGGVMYSDFALGEFISEASRRPWAGNTVIVVVADHCASSAGSTELPLANYHIPALIYAPWLVEPAAVDAVASQMDLMPTLFAMLGWEPDLRLYGRDVLSPRYLPRAPVATYQDLGYLVRDTLTVISPGREARQFWVDAVGADQIPVANPGGEALQETVSLYQHASAPPRRE